MKTSTATAGLLIAASVFSSLASASVTIDWGTVGNAGNAADPLTGYGAVGYDYKIGKYEVTNAQYGAFLNTAAQTDSYGLCVMVRCCAYGKLDDEWPRQRQHRDGCLHP